MRKLFSILAFMFCGLIYSAPQSKDTIQSQTPVLDKTEQLVDKYGGKLANAFSETIEGAKPMVKETFETVVMLQIAKGIGCLLPLFFFIIFMYLFKKEYDRINAILASDNVPDHMNSSYGVFGEDNVNVFIILYLIFAVISFILALIFTYDGVLYLMAPKWFAIKEIIGVFK